MTSRPETLQPVAAFWKDFDLEKRRASYDVVGLGITEAHEDAVRRRRHLAEATQSFRQTAETKVVRAVADLLKQYQQEIDRLTQRAKNGERAFLDVYQGLSEAPDPAAALTASCEMAARLPELEAEVRRQGQELAEYSAESEEIRNQHSTIRRLEEKIRGLEAQLQSHDAAMDATRQEVEAALREEMAAREGTMQRAVEEATAKLEKERKLHQASQDQLLQMQGRSEEMKARYGTELEMATTEVEKLQNRVLELQAQRTYESLDPVAATEENAGNEALETALAEERELTTGLKEELASLSRGFEAARAEATSREEALEAKLAEQTARVATHAADLAARPTTEELTELQSQLRIFQAVQYNLDPNGEVPSELATMESLLMKKTKHLEHELTGEKVRQKELQEALSVQGSQLEQVLGQLASHRDLVARLEEDLVAAQNSASLGRASSTSDTEEGATDGQGGGSMVSILKNQRDRLKQRTRILEAKLHETERCNQGLKAEAENALADNVALVERLRYLQGYKKDQGQQRDVESGLAAEQKYLQRYEERMNPFHEFQGRQRERRRKALNLVDRTVLIVGDLVFGYKYARIFLCLYIALLHVLVMTMLGSMTDRHHRQTTEGMETSCLEHGFVKP